MQKKMTWTQLIDVADMCKASYFLFSIETKAYHFM